MIRMRLPRLQIERWSLRQRMAVTGCITTVAAILMAVAIVLRIHGAGMWVNVNIFVPAILMILVLRIWTYHPHRLLIGGSSALMAALICLLLILCVRQLVGEGLASSLRSINAERFQRILILSFLGNLVLPVVLSISGSLTYYVPELLARRKMAKESKVFERDRHWDIESLLLHCSTWSHKDGARLFLEIVEEIGGLLFHTEHNETSGEYSHRPGVPVVDSYSLITDIGAIEPTFVAHELLRPSSEGLGPNGEGLAEVTYLRDSIPGPEIAQILPHDQASRINCIASGQLALVERLYPKLRPKYSFVRMSEIHLTLFSLDELSIGKIRSLFWANLFGPVCVGYYGRDFLLNAPGWRVEELDDEGILYVVTESLTEWRSGNLDHVSAYFRSRYPYLQLYRHDPGLIQTPDRVGRKKPKSAD